jgi:hypothetical protein
VRAGKITLDDDRYFDRIIYVDTLFRNHFYNDHIGWVMWRAYLLLYILVFYGSNYLLHPSRIVRTSYNLLTNRLESRAEMALVDLLSRSKMTVRPAPGWGADASSTSALPAVLRDGALQRSQKPM